MPSKTDPELEALPAPRRPWRNSTVVALILVCCGSVMLMSSLWPQAQYALTSGQPTEIGNLAELKLGAQHFNTWVHGSGPVSPHAVGYRRPLDSDRFRLAPIEGQPRLWVEVREPAGTNADHYVPPFSFVGRLVPLSSAGLSHSGLVPALRATRQDAPPDDAWLLIDGAAPRTTRWTLGVMALLACFVGFSAWGMATLLRPVRTKAAPMH